MRSTLLATIAGLVLASTPMLVDRDHPAAGFGERGRMAPAEVLGKTMVTAQGTEIGIVAQVRQDPAGRVEALIVERPGPDGHDEKVAVMPDRVQYARNEKVRTSIPEDEVGRLPAAE